MASQPPNQDKPVGVSPGRAGDTQGAVVNPIYATRDVMHYAVTNHELRAISFLNTLIVTFSSLGSFLLAAALSIWIGVLIEDTLTDTRKVLAYVAAPIICLISLVAFLLACITWRVRRSELDTIRRESRQ